VPPAYADWLRSKGVRDAGGRELPPWSVEDALRLMEFRKHNVEYGQTYTSSAIVDDETPAPAAIDDVRVYAPGTRPGAPLPHAEVEDLDGGHHALMDLVRPGQLLLIAGEDGNAWCDAARRLAETAGVPLRAVRIGHADGDYRDPRCTWLRLRQITAQGAVLVRPDRFVAWRNAGAAANPVGELGAALTKVLCHAVA
jgi:2,4-dichlorophenol 6-monooxygenase